MQYYNFSIYERRLSGARSKRRETGRGGGEGRMQKERVPTARPNIASPRSRATCSTRHSSAPNQNWPRATHFHSLLVSAFSIRSDSTCFEMFVSHTWRGIIIMNGDICATEAATVSRMSTDVKPKLYPFPPPHGPSRYYLHKPSFTFNTYIAQKKKQRVKARARKLQSYWRI